MSVDRFPEFVRALPEADLPFPGLRGWLLQSPRGVLMLNESDVDVDVPAHAHGNQWGAVLAGTIELTIGGDARVYGRGDSYYVPDGVTHSARIRAGFRALDLFEDPQRYRPRGAEPGVMIELNQTLAQLLAKLCVELETEDAIGVISRAIGLLELVQRTKRRGGRLCFINERGEIADVAF